MAKYKVKCFVEEFNDDIAKSICKYEDCERFATFNTINEAKEYVEKQIAEIMKNNLNDEAVYKYGSDSVKVQNNNDYSTIYTWKTEKVNKPVSIIDKLKNDIILNNGNFSDDELECNLDKLILVARASGYNEANKTWIDAFENGCLEDYAKSFTE